MHANDLPVVGQALSPAPPHYSSPSERGVAGSTESAAFDLAAPARGSGRIGWAASEALALRHLGAQLLPLLLREDAADAQQETGIGFFELGAGLRDLVDLSQDFGLVGRVGGHQWLPGDLFPLRIGVEIDQAQAILLEDVIHLFLLVGGEGELLDHLDRKSVVCISQVFRLASPRNLRRAR